MLCGLRREGRNDDGPYSKGNKDCAANDSSMVSKRRSIPDEIRGLTTVELIKREGSSLGLTISGGSDKDGKPRVSNLRPAGLASR
ncbi:glutamate receptor-interacting protein 2a isoform X3 [Tachysurus ichikawai]